MIVRSPLPPLSCYPATAGIPVLTIVVQISTIPHLPPFLYSSARSSSCSASSPSFLYSNPVVSYYPCRQIKKAYRKLALRLHPDKTQTQVSHSLTYRCRHSYPFADVSRASQAVVEFAAQIFSGFGMFPGRCGSFHTC